jgi:FSR family fosmidomycin resistance protein-like MFS transporter
MGLASSFEIVFILALLGRVGATIFHPLASKIVINYESGKRVRSMTVFTIGGTIGRALSPVLVGLIVSFFGLRGLTLILLPGLIASVALFLVKPPSTFESSPEISLSPPKKATFDSSRKKGFISLGMLPLLLISVVVFTRSVGEMGMITFIPFFLGSKGIELLEATFYLSVMLSVGIAGELMGGVLSDRYGRKPLIVASLAVCSPLIYLFLHTETSLSLLPIALYGLIIALPVATLIVLAAEFAPKRVGFASGLVWSLMSGSGGLLAMGFGLIADKLGLFLVLHLIALFPLIAGLIALALPKQKRS